MSLQTEKKSATFFLKPTTTSKFGEYKYIYSKVRLQKSIRTDQSIFSNFYKYIFESWIPNELETKEKTFLVFCFCCCLLLSIMTKKQGKQIRALSSIN